MKKVVAIAAFLCAGMASVQAQDLSKNALGLRIGGNNGFGVEASYQVAVAQKNRIEIDLGWRSGDHIDHVKAVGTYQWVFPIENGFNWYVGPGVGIAHSSWDYGVGPYRSDDSKTYVLIAGQIGIEYNIKSVPLQLSLDFRPEFYLSDGLKDDFGPDFAFGIRYKF